MSVPVFNSLSVLQACVVEAIDHSQALLAQLLSAANQSLGDQAQSTTASPQVRQQADEALRLLQAQQPALHRAYPLALLESFAQNRTLGASPPPLSKTAILDTNSLSLADENKHHAPLELQRAQEQVTQATGAALAQLNALVSAAKGLQSVQAEHNPLRPENYLRALQQILNGCTDVPTAVRETWMQHLLPALGPALRNVYERTNHVLRERGIVPLNDSTDLADLASANLSAQAQPAACIPDQPQPSGRTQPLASQLPPVNAVALATEVVAQMMDNIVQNTHLLPAIRQLLQSMEPAIGQLAGHDPTFFSNPEHPARCLLNQMIERGLALRAENTPELERFMTLLQQISHYLTQQDTRQAAPFAAAVQILEQTCDQWAQQEKQQQAAQSLAAERRNRYQRLSQEIAANIRKLPDTGSVPPEIMQFATGPWTHVIAQAQLAQSDSNNADPDGYLALVPLLFWSVRAGIAMDERRQIAQAMPNMLHTLQRGLTQFGYTASETDRFLVRLQQLHQKTLSTVAPEPHLSSIKARPHPAQRQPDPDIDIEFESGYKIPAELDASMATPTATATVVEHADFPIGTWVELQGNQQVLRTQLTWASPKGTLFLFTGTDGSTQSMTRRIRDRLLTEGALRIITPK